ncbi:hypothetical protein [Rathayibacter sp. AY1A4]|uniref:hypothetical protein n=1 Tax=Rathayibacter sp. AY1A4 TaxID=2080522 RepID=UPI0011B06E51|nr:hypothetical protein [Rathayibacter sp. AY1A4]
MIVTAAARPLGVLTPHAEVTVESPPEGTSTVTVTRRQERRDFLTRGFVELDRNDDLFVRDFEMPFGLPVTYTATAVDAAGAVLATAQSSTIRMPTKPSTVTIHDPTRPANALTLALGRNAITGGTRAMGGGLVSIANRSVPVSVNTVRGGWARLALDVVTYQDAEAEALEALLGGYDDDLGSGVLCFRVAGNVPPLIPRTFFGRVEQPEPQWWPGGDGNGNPRAEWALRATEVQPPSPALVEAIVTHEDWTAWFRDNYGWEGFTRTFPTWSAANRSLVALGWARRPLPRRASWADLEAWVRDNGGWSGFNATFASWADAMQAPQVVGWASR